MTAPYGLDRRSGLGSGVASAGLLLGALFLALFIGALAALSGEFAGIVGIVLLLSLTIVANYRIGVWALCFVFPLSGTVLLPRQLLGLVGLNPMNVLELATLGAFALAYFASKLRSTPLAAPPLPRPLVLLYLLPFAFAAILGSQSVELIPDFYRTTLKVINYATPTEYLRDVFARPLLLIVFSLLVAVVFRDAKKPELLLIPAVAAALVLCSLIAYVVFLFGGNLTLLGSPAARSYLSGLGMHANEISLLLNSLLAIVLFCVRGSTGALRLWLLAVSSLLVVFVLLTFSRGGFLGLFVVALAFLVNSGSWRSAAAALVVAVLVALVLPNAVVDRATYGVGSGNRDQISAGRVDEIWLPLLPTVLNSPLIGGGLSSILWSPPARSGEISVAQTHNAYLALLLDMGLIGFGLVMAFYAWAWRMLRFASRSAPTPFLRQFFAGGAVTIVLLFTQGLTDDRFTPTVPQTYMWFAIGAAIGFLRRSTGVSEPSAAPATNLPLSPARARA